MSTTKPNEINRIRIYLSENKQTGEKLSDERFYCVSKRLLNWVPRSGDSFYSSPPDEKERKDNKLVRPETFEVIDRLLSINGIVRLIVYPFSVNIMKAAAFDWAELNPSIIDALKEVLFQEVDDCEIEVQDHTRKADSPKAGKAE